MNSEVGMRKWEKRIEDRRQRAGGRGQRLMNSEVGMWKSEKTTQRA